MGKSSLPDIHIRSLRAAGCIYQVNHKCPCYNYYIILNYRLQTHVCKQNIIPTSTTTTYPLGYKYNFEMMYVVFVSPRVNTVNTPFVIYHVIPDIQVDTRSTIIQLYIVPTLQCYIPPLLSQLFISSINLLRGCEILVDLCSGAVTATPATDCSVASSSMGDGTTSSKLVAVSTGKLIHSRLLMWSM